MPSACVLVDERVLLTTDFKDLKLYKRGKVRDLYDLGDKLLLVSTDRISCFDVVLADGIPCKGRVFTALSCFWFDFLREAAPHHLISAEEKDYPAQLQKYRRELAGRSMLVLKAKPLPVECVVRGYLSGSGWKEYRQSGSICGIKLPAGMRESDKFPEPIFTPSTKAEAGHDTNVAQGYVEELIGKDTAGKLRQVSIAIYRQASEFADRRGIIIADTKFEFGIYEDKIILIDEALTPDSSRFWPAAGYAPGRAQASFDKQFVRDYLESLDWDKRSPPPKLPPEIIARTREKYLEAYKRITGREL